MRAAMPSLPELHTPTEDRWFLREVVLPNTEVWVAELDGHVVGFTALGSRDGVAFMEHIYVAPEYPARGIGSELMTRAKDPGERVGVLWPGRSQHARTLRPCRANATSPSG